MNTRIQCLSFLVVLFTLNPLSIAELIEFIKGRVNNINIKTFFRNLTFIYVFLILISFYMIPESCYISMPKNNTWILVGIISSPIVILIEIIVAYIILNIKGKDTNKIQLAQAWVKCDKTISLYTILIGILEEIVYRQIWFYILSYVLRVNIILVIIISSLFYSLNHLTLGKYVIIQKMISGIIFCLLYYFSGNSILIPILCHGLQNLILVIRGHFNESIS